MNKSLFRILLLATVLATQAAFFDFSPPAGNPATGSPMDSIKRVSRATYLIQHEYYDTSRILPFKMFQEGLHEMAKDIPELLPKFENDRLIFQIGTKAQIIETSGIKKLNDILMPASQVFGLVKSHYTGSIKMEDLEYAFISGMLSVLDPHSSILPPKAFEEFKAQTQGEYGGLGIVIGLKDEELTVVAPIEGTPAWRAGIQTDDKILQIGEQATINMSLNDAVDMMRGKPGSAITLRIKSKNIDAHDVLLTREVIVIESVQSSVMTEDGKSVGVLRVKGFQEDTYDDMVKQFDKMKDTANLSGLILDLRGNPGGLLDQAIMITDKFLQGGDIVYTVGADNKDQEVAIAQKQDGDVTLPLIILVNEGSASASEIVAGALKNNSRAIVMGTQSFGKGSVQSVFGLRDGSSVKLTIAQYLTPGRVSIQAIGIIPDLHLYPAVINDDFFDIIEDAHYGEEKLDSHLDNNSHCSR
jgi:carboxyl-terminal processing protease